MSQLYFQIVDSIRLVVGVLGLCSEKLPQFLWLQVPCNLKLLFGDGHGGDQSGEANFGRWNLADSADKFLKGSWDHGGCDA